MSTRSSWSTITSPACSPSIRPGKLLGMPDTGIRMRGRRSTPGRYFQVAEPGTGWGGTDISDPLVDHRAHSTPKAAWPGLRLLMVSTTGEQYAYFELDEALRPVERELPERPARVRRAHRGELRAGAVHGAVHGRRRRLAARRRHREPGAPHALGQGGADPRHLRRRAGLCLAGRRHHLHGRRDARARERLRLRADAGARRADRVHHAARRLRRPRRPHGRCAAAVEPARQRGAARSAAPRQSLASRCPARAKR